MHNLHGNEYDHIMVYDHNHNPHDTNSFNTSCKWKAGEDIFIRPKKKIVFKEIQKNNCSKFNETDIKCSLRKNV